MLQRALAISSCTQECTYLLVLAADDFCKNQCNLPVFFFLSMLITMLPLYTFIIYITTDECTHWMQPHKQTRQLGNKIDAHFHSSQRHVDWRMRNATQRFSQMPGTRNPKTLCQHEPMSHSIRPSPSLGTLWNRNVCGAVNQCLTESSNCRPLKNWHSMFKNRHGMQDEKSWKD